MRVRTVDQFVCFVLRVGTLGFGTNLECKVMRTGKSSDDRSELGSARRVYAGIFRTTAKSMRSGIFRLAQGQ
jgi:hypothetical protein